MAWGDALLLVAVTAALILGAVLAFSRRDLRSGG
jgi:hypothetical protein